MRSPLLAILAVMGLLCLALCGVPRTTRVGVQCPTAPIQTVVVRDCCNHVVSRAPRPGDRVFVQCRCAEKRSATVKATVTTKIVLVEMSPSPLVAVAPLRPSSVAFAYRARLVETSLPPATRPPA